VEEGPCAFCGVPAGRITAENSLAVAIRDAFPVNPGHTLVITRRHVVSWFDTTADERIALFALVDRVRAQLDAELKPAGYNIGVNVGAAGGQTVMHLHVHVIPRFRGDVDDPAGGVRFVIPARGDYRTPGRIPSVRRGRR
jgi:diadenosine tetraphosphate (Ap4A) HIT family hydrolase